VVEHSPGAEAWWAAAARSLGTGSLIAFDYGFDASDRFRPGRSNGTLRGYSGHQLVEDVLDAPGLIDLTAHVDFGRIQEVGEAAGLATTELGSQHRLLSRWMAEDIASGNGPDAWTPARLRQWQALSHPAHFGQAFKVLVQERP
jgi:SAM-dependent MidA family methyltransferase